MQTVLYLGTDLVPIERITLAYRRYGKRFLQKMLTPQEMAYCAKGLDLERQTVRFLHRVAARIATKEAAAKALGVGIKGLGWQQGIHWHEVEVVAQPQQAPRLSLSGKALAEATAQAINQWRISFSHDGGYATATVIGLG